MKKEEFYFDSSDGITKIRAVRYIPDGDIKAVLQISHGMVEFIDRYEDFASFLTNKGYLVTGNDHLGHGGSVTNKDKWGYFAKEEGHKKVLDDVHKLTLITKEYCPNKPYFLLGHSMGSFICRYYLFMYGDELDGAIVMGTGQQAPGLLQVAKVLTRSVARSKGWEYRSSMLNGLAICSYNKKWEPSETHLDWLTKDETIVDKYFHEPMNNFVFTANGFYGLFSMIEQVINVDNINKMPKNLPVLITSGQEDPVGNFSKDPKALYEIYKKANMKDVQIKLYPNDRHEILNELDRDVVYNDIYNWLESKIQEA